MALPTSTGLRFSATFNIGTTPTLTLTDLIASYTGTTIIGWFECTDPDGIIFHQGSQSSPDVGNTSPLTWVVSGITLPLDSGGLLIKKGTYTFKYTVKSDSLTAVYITKTYDFQYDSPTVEISLTADCRTSTLTSEDITDYYFYTTTLIEPVSLTRTHTVTRPTGSSANDPGSVTGTGTAYALRTIGGGVTAATRLWTGVWQTTISTVLVYNMATWGTSTWVIVNDTVTGADHIDVTCSDCACTLNTCWENLVIRWKDAEANHAKNVFDLRYKIALGGSLWTEYYNRERCGEDTSAICTELSTLLASEGCTCSEGDTSSVVVVPWGAASAGASASTFAFWSFTTTPTTEGQAGDWGIETDGNDPSAYAYLYYNNAGTWTQLLDLKGTAGSTTSATATNVLYNNYANLGTSAGHTLETLDTYTLTADTFETAGDVLHVKAVYQLAANDNGKTVHLYYGATMLVEYFTDALINTTNNTVVLEAFITSEGSASQTVETMITTYGSVIPGFTTKTIGTSVDTTITARATNTTDTANDIVCKKFTIERFNKS